MSNQKTSENLSHEAETLFGHLVELRTRVVRSAWFIVLGMALCYAFSDKLFDVIRTPIAPYLPDGGLVFTAPIDKFMAHLKVSFFGGLILSCPLWLNQVWGFVAPGLYAKERKYGFWFIFFASFFFLTGVFFAYFVVFPAAFKFLMSYGGTLDKPMITINEYLSFVLVTAALFGVAFELPVVIVLLGAMGIVGQKGLREKRRFAIVGLAVIAAIFTPPDVLSMIFLLGPLILLYEFSILIVGHMERSRSKDQVE